MSQRVALLSVATSHFGFIKLAMGITEGVYCELHLPKYTIPWIGSVSPSSSSSALCCSSHFSSLSGSQPLPFPPPLSSPLFLSLSLSPMTLIIQASVKKSFRLFFKPLFIFIMIWIFLHLFLYFEKERERARAGEGQRERISSRLHTVSLEPDAGLELTNHEVMTLAETRSQTLNRLSHPDTPWCGSSKHLFSCFVK